MERLLDKTARTNLGGQDIMAKSTWRIQRGKDSMGRLTFGRRQVQIDKACCISKEKNSENLARHLGNMAGTRKHGEDSRGRQEVYLH